MRRNILNRVVLLACVALSVACAPKKLVVVKPTAPTTEDIPKSDDKAETLTLLKSKDVQYNTLALKGKADLAINGNENSVSMNIRIQKDKKIWVIVTAAGGIVEVARAMITPDSLFLLNKLEKTYAKKPFSYVHNFTNKQVNFSMLQAVLSGNTIPDLMNTSADLNLENGTWVIKGVNGDLGYRSIFNTLLKVSETTLNDAKAGQAFKVVYGEYTPITNAIFPSTLKINSMAGTKKIDIAIEFSKIESNVPVEFPFTVPKNYELIK
jgi:hypothetical protein